jgi:hypothetical protein
VANPYQAEIDRAVAESEAACKHALESTPEKYRSHLYFMDQSKKVGPYKSSVYAPIRVPSIKAAGRILWAIDDHVSRDERLNTETEFIYDGETLICKATVTSSYRGVATGHSVVRPGEKGIDAKYPREKAETTAVSRALGFLGYGILDAGIASAEDLMDTDASAEHDEAVSDTPTHTDPDMASEKQMGLLYAELARCGILDGDKRALVASLYRDGMTKTEASEAITALKLRNVLPRNWLKAYLRMLCGRQGLDTQAMNTQIRDGFKIESFDTMTKKQQSDLIEWVATWEPEASQVPAEPASLRLPDEEAQPEEPDDIPENIYRPGEPINMETATMADQWEEMIGTICQNNPDATREDVVYWLLDEIGAGEYKDVSSMPKPRLERVQRMTPEMLARSLKANMESRQTSLPL